MLLIVRFVRMNVHLPGGVVHYPKPPSMWKVVDRLRWRIENSVGCESTLHACVRPTLQCCVNQLGSPAITHRWRGPPSFRERGLW